MFTLERAPAWKNLNFVCSPLKELPRRKTLILYVHHRCILIQLEKFCMFTIVAYEYNLKLRMKMEMKMKMRMRMRMIYAFNTTL